MSESETKVIDEIIEALTKNQELLENNKRLTAKQLRVFVADLNFSFLEIVKNIKNIRYTEKKINKENKIKTVSMYA